MAKYFLSTWILNKMTIERKILWQILRYTKRIRANGQTHSFAIADSETVLYGDPARRCDTDYPPFFVPVMMRG